MNKTRRPYSRYLDAKTLPTPGGIYSPDAIREMQAAMLDALRSGEPLPEEMQVHLAFAFEYLCKGIANDLLTPIRRHGGREAPIAKHAQKEAIRYLRWCEDGRIKDAKAVLTVAKAYDVEERTVRNWRTKWKGAPTPELCEEWGAEQVIDLMKVSGGAYRRFIPKPTPRR